MTQQHTCPRVCATAHALLALLNPPPLLCESACRSERPHTLSVATLLMPTCVSYGARPVNPNQMPFQPCQEPLALPCATCDERLWSLDKFECNVPHLCVRYKPL